MLKIHYGDLDDERYIHAPAVYFDNVYEDSWITDDVSVDMIRDIDNSKVVDVNLIYNEVIGSIPPTMLSGGVKTLILINNDPEHIFNISACGENCADWILKLGNEKDVIVRLGYPMPFKGDYEIEILNNNTIVHNYSEYIEVLSDFF